MLLLRHLNQRGDAAHTILTITDDGQGLALLTCAAAVTGLVNVNDHLLIAGTSGGVYDGTFVATAVAGATIALDTGFGDPGTGGTWALA